jgi:hypothetical protein
MKSTLGLIASLIFLIVSVAWVYIDSKNLIAYDCRWVNTPAIVDLPQQVIKECRRIASVRT